MRFTRAVVLSRRGVTGECSSSIGSYVVLNPDGHVLTSSHIVGGVAGQEAAVRKFGEYEAEARRVRENPKWTPKRKRRALAKLEGEAANSVLRNSSAWWSQDGLSLVRAVGNSTVDLALGQLEPWDPAWVEEYPKFKDPTKPLRPGTSLCRLGFPLAEITPEFRDNVFHLAPEHVPPPFFPIEGIFTRNVSISVDDWQHGYPAQFVETSSPGLKGQSGGPIFDVSGTVWGIQSQTRHFELGFSPKTGDGEVEHQFLGVGWGTHPASIVGFLESHCVDFEVAEY